MRRVLASASPRRREILETLGVSFEVEPSRFEEVALAGEAPDALAKRLAVEKAREVAGRLSCDRDTFVLGADTVVILGERALGKPTDDEDARAMLSALSGGWHEVATGVVLFRGEEPLGALLERTRVRFRTLSAEVIARYVATGEGRDKAGSYAVQGIGAGLVERIEGCWTNVVGLPAVSTLSLLERHGALEAWPVEGRG